MTPKLNGIDHLHVYVADLKQAEEWYGTILGLLRDNAQGTAEINNGPLMLENPEGNIHIALFEKDQVDGSSVIAFAADGKNFLSWKVHLESHGLSLRVADHKTSYSLYFNDPDDNMHEITSYEHGFVAQQLN